MNRRDALRGGLAGLFLGAAGGEASSKETKEANVYIWFDVTAALGKNRDGMRLEKFSKLEEGDIFSYVNDPDHAYLVLRDNVLGENGERIGVMVHDISKDWQ